MTIAQNRIARPASIPCPLAAYCNATSTSCLRRAVSTAYYVVFHCLAGAAANLLVGRSRGSAWHRVYLALEHGKAKSACGHKQAMKRFQPEIQYFADTFVILQDARHRADYALEGRYYKLDVLADIDQAENAITPGLFIMRLSGAHILDSFTPV